MEKHRKNTAIAILYTLIRIDRDDFWMRAKVLPEREGWVDREKLFDFSGKNRKPQMALAEKWKLDDYANPQVAVVS